VIVDERDGHLTVTVEDDGIGGADPGNGSGLQGLRDRLASLDGTLEIVTSPGGGTRLRARLPSRQAPRSAPR
jgi:signal transduction histidine kinase